MVYGVCNPNPNPNPNPYFIPNHNPNFIPDPNRLRLLQTHCGIECGLLGESYGLIRGYGDINDDSTPNLEPQMYVHNGSGPWGLPVVSQNLLKKLGFLKFRAVSRRLEHLYSTLHTSVGTTQSVSHNGVKIFFMRRDKVFDNSSPNPNRTLALNLTLVLTLP
jgi:hypothetical protein